MYCKVSTYEIVYLEFINIFTESVLSHQFEDTRPKQICVISILISTNFNLVIFVSKLVFYKQILLIVAVIAAVSARPQDGHGHKHKEHAYSSQKIVQHHGHAEKILVDVRYNNNKFYCVK